MYNPTPMGIKEHITNHIESSSKPLSRKELIKHFDLTYTPNTVYRAIQNLLSDNKLIEMKDKRLIVNPNPAAKINYQINWLLPEVLQTFQTSSEKLPLINVIKQDPEAFSRHLVDEILPEYGEILTVNLVNLLLLFQAASGNFNIFEQYPDLPVTDEIRAEAERQLNDLLRN